jgi:hypothetical protein
VLRGDVIVAVDGYAVTSNEQYDVAVATRADPTVRLILWRKGRYQEVGPRIRHGWVWGRVGDHEPAATASGAKGPTR